MMTAFNIILSLVLLVFLAAIARVMWRSFALPLLAVTSPAQSQRSAAMTRLAETTVLLTLSFFFLLLFATDLHQGGHLLVLAKLPGSLAHTALAAVLVASGSLLVAAALSCAGHQRTAFGLAILTIAIYHFSYGFHSANSTDRSIPYTIVVSGEDVPGAVLFVNGVPLGPLPYHSTVADFLAKVPVWNQPPADFDTDVTNSIDYGLHTQRLVPHPRWLSFTMPQVGQPPVPPSEPHTYYARVQYAGEWASLSPGSFSGDWGDANVNDNDNGPDVWGSGNSSIGGFSLMKNSLAISLPERRLRLNRLLNIARAQQYHVDAAWFTAAETFHTTVWRALNRLTDHEPEMQQMIDAWARWKYPIDAATTPDAAWAVFLKIADDADAAGFYDTLSPQGRAINLLAPHLPPERLFPRAAALLENEGYSYSHQWRFGQFQFATYDSAPMPAAGLAPPSDFVTAHALYAHHMAQIRAGIYPTLVQAHFVPALLQSGPTNDNVLRVAAALGGPVAAQFFLRHDCLTPKRFPDHDAMEIDMSEHFNKWLYYLSQTADPSAVAFLNAHPEPVLKMAAALSPKNPGEIGSNIDFIFQSPQLAAAFWPQFAASARTGKYFDIERFTMQFDYLSRMNAEPDRYVEVLHGTAAHLSEMEASNIFQAFKSISDPARRAAIFSAFRADLQKTPMAPELVRPFGSEDNARTILLRNLNYAEHPYHDGGPGSFTEQIRALQTAAELDHVVLWLQSPYGVQGLRDQLLTDPDPRLRIIAARVISPVPTPARQAQLNELSMHDPDAGVRQCASELLQSIQGLSQSPLPLDP